MLVGTRQVPVSTSAAQAGILRGTAHPCPQTCLCNLSSTDGIRPTIGFGKAWRIARRSTNLREAVSDATRFVTQASDIHSHLVRRPSRSVSPHRHSCSVARTRRSPMTAGTTRPRSDSGVRWPSGTTPTDAQYNLGFMYRARPRGAAELYRGRRSGFARLPSRACQPRPPVRVTMCSVCDGRCL